MSSSRWLDPTLGPTGSRVGPGRGTSFVEPSRYRRRYCATGVDLGSSRKKTSVTSVQGKRHLQGDLLVERNNENTDDEINKWTETPQVRFTSIPLLQSLRRTPNTHTTPRPSPSRPPPGVSLCAPQSRQDRSRQDRVVSFRIRRKSDQDPIVQFHPLFCI